MYDWANSAFATTIMAAVFPVFYAQVAAARLPDHIATSHWAFTTSIALLIIALISPVLGAVADFLGAKKRFVAVFMAMGTLFTATLYFVGQGDWLFASAVFIVANVGFAGANVFYESLLPNIASEEEIDRVSTAGYAIGYVGGGLLLALNVLWITFPQSFGMADAEQASRVSFISVAVWWSVFSVPLFRGVREPARRLETGESVELNPVRVGFSRVWETLRELRRHRQVFLFLLAFWFYNDGIGTIIKMAVIFGEEVGIPNSVLIGSILIVQFVGIPFTFAFGKLADRIGTKNGIYITLLVYAAICIYGYFLRESWQFLVLGVAVATVQGGAQALSRSLYASIVPRGKSSEFFGFFSVSAKFAGIFGPLIFGLVGRFAGSSRLSILSLIGFFIIGILLLRLVDVNEGRRLASEEDAELVPATA
jgi:UMF1 family MFS transporter